MAEIKNVVKKGGELTPMVIPMKEEAEPIKEISTADESYRQIVESAASVGVTVPDNGNDLTMLAQALVDKLLQIDTNLRPLAQAIEKDERVGELVASLCQGETLEDALLENEIIAENQMEVSEDDFRKSLVETDRFCTYHHLEHSAIDCFAQFVEETIARIGNAKITQELLSLFWKSFTFDQEIEAAFRAGILKGRNMKIEELRSEREENDGMGSVSGGASISKEPAAPGYIERIIRSKR